MNTKTLSDRALSTIDQYLHFRAGNAVCSVPYFNNKTTRARGALRVDAGKGSPKEILDELKSLVVKSHTTLEALSDASLKKILTDSNIGVDCSAFAYYVLNAESEDAGKGRLDKHIRFVNARGIIGKIRSSLRPIENCDVATLAHEENSRIVPMKEIQPGDMISMLSGPDGNDRDHLLVIHQAEYQNFVPTRLHYSHAIAYPEDGIYGTGIRQGTIDILKPESTLLDQQWTENGKTGPENGIFLKAQRSKTEIRRLNWF